MVPYVWAVSNFVAMRNAGIATILQPVDGAGHGLPGLIGPRIRQQSSRFLYFMMDLGHAGGQPASVGRVADRQTAELARRYPALVP